MRVSSYESDPGFGQYLVARENGKTVKVYLDGEEVHGCTVADDDAGFVKRAVLNAEGHAQIDPNDPEQFWEERVEGHVRIVTA